MEMSKLFIQTRLFIVVVMLILPFTLFAEEKKDEQPIQIEADNMKYFGDKLMSEFRGNVIVLKDGMKMTSEEMDVFFTPEREVKEIFSRGNVKIEKEGLLALSGKARIYQLEEKIVLTENAKVWQGDNYLEGDKVTLFNDNEKLFVDKGDQDKRVKIILAPQKEK
ncbi:MAG: lipopolysaccharide transport periplasmic protein LptA [Denitrovibrio sp.]|nr:MAG: lipopolysaccharide transport periplasmic protein LptA [Denitrovibrio sp.]